MRITEELRKWMRKHHILLDGLTDLTAIVDRIDEEHVRRQEDLIDETLGGLMKMTDEKMAENGWVRLPKDGDGEYIHLGDVMDKGKVTCIRNCGNGWEVVLNSLYTYDASSLHHRKPTVEDVLREMMRDAACQFNDDGSCCVGLTDKQLAEYAQKLQLREES